MILSNMTDLSVIIPSRNEPFLLNTINDILANSHADTEIIIVADGNWPDPSIEDDPKVSMIYHSKSIGQRAATNEAARLSKAKFIMKVDAHCAFAEGFDITLMEDFEHDWTMVPQMRNLHAFDWKCKNCEHRTYQGPYPKQCEKCSNQGFEQVIVWKPRAHTRNNFMRFDSDLHFQYWREYKKRAKKGDLVETMSILGACFMMHRERYWELDGLDERHGSWGQMGTEIACKTWLSGGRLLCNKKTWFAHMFRTQSGFSFPYPNPGSQVRKAREHSHWLWKEDNWPKAKYPLSWLIDKFAPVPGWEDEPLKKVAHTPIVTDTHAFSFAPPEKNKDRELSKGLVYYTDNRLDDHIMQVNQYQIENVRNGYDLVSVSLYPINFGRNLVLDSDRGILTMFKQILKGLEELQTDVVFLCEHDILYSKSHFEFTPPKEDIYYYNENVWKLRASDGQALFYYVQQTSGLCAFRELLLQHYQKRVEIVERDGFTRRMGFEPGTHGRKERVDDFKAKSWTSFVPNIDIRHQYNLTPSRFSQDKFRNKKYCRGWTMANEIPGWGRTKGRFEEFLRGIVHG